MKLRLLLACAALTALAAMADDPYVPGLGDFMGATQVRHAKLWFAGNERNWPLAAYEVGELREGLDAAAHLNPVFKGIPVQTLLAQYITQPLADVGSAIDAHDEDGFQQSFDRLSAACNGCHQASGHGFIVIKRPTALPATNQRFTPDTP
ncbi:MAG: hypothetical protein KGM83_08725 [Betaproteobacteria bacterium]|nr:hypothetical protein [Betaproteobacteria bacterium]